MTPSLIDMTHSDDDEGGPPKILGPGGRYMIWGHALYLLDI